MALTYEDVKKEFMAAVDGDAKCQKLMRQIYDGKGTYKTANDLAVRVGQKLGGVLKAHEPINGIDEWDYIDLIPKTWGLDHQIMADACKGVQETMNQKAGLGIKYKEPKFDMDRVNGIITELTEHPDFSSINKTFYDQLVNFSQNVVDESIRENAGVMYRAGIKTMVIRQAEAGGCKWCQEQAGVYDYNEVKDRGNDVWRRHENCNCEIDFITERAQGFYSERVNNQVK